SRFRRRALRLSFSSPVFSSQLSRPPTCSTERRPLIETRNFTPRCRVSEMSVTCCRFGRNVRLVLLLAWETLLPTSRPLPVSSQMRDMSYLFFWVGRPGASRKGGADSLAAEIRQPVCACARDATDVSPARYAPKSFGKSNSERIEPMHRTLLLIVALLVIVGIVLVATGVIHLNRDANGNVTVTANPVTVGTENRTIQVPVVTMENRTIQTPTVSVGSNQAANAQ